MINPKDLLEVIVLDFKPVSTFQVYAKQTKEDWIKGFPVSYINNIYWKDEKSPSGFGPFHNLYDALQHFKKTVNMEKGEGPYIETSPAPKPVAAPQLVLKEPALTNLVEVDFKAKRIIK